MIIQLDWLKEYVDFNLSTEDLGQLLSMSGLEVEAVEQVELPGGRRTEVMELNVTPNRGYCLSYLGVAREVAGLLDKPLRHPVTDLGSTSGNPPIMERLKVSNDAPDLCPRYSALVIEDVKPAPSPDWLQDQMRAIGLRPINNIVDITNFVLMEYGQPLHAFDYDQLAGQTIIVRRAKEREAFRSLTGKDLKLDSRSLVIADAEKPVALAGVVGGANSEVTLATRNVALESACFEPVSVRKTSKTVAIRTDSSYRFERGVDIATVITAQDRAAHLILELAGGSLCEGRIDQYPEPQVARTLSLRNSRVQQILGKKLLPGEIQDLLNRMGMQAQPNTEGFDVEIPFFRPNLSREIDLIEEIARVKGFGEFAPASPRAEIRSVPVTRKQRAITGMRQTLRNFGYSEAINYSFIEGSEAEAFKEVYAETDAKCIPLNNPLSVDMNMMRTSLLPGLLKTALRNIHKGQKPIKLFELGNVFYREANGEKKELSSFACLIHGIYENSIWKPQGKNYDFFDLKGMLDLVRDRFKLELEYSSSVHFLLNPEKSLECFVHGDRLGFFGELSNDLCRRSNLPTPIYVCEIDLDRLVRHIPKAMVFDPIPRFPETYRDLSILIDKSILSETVTDLIRNSSQPILNRVELYDQFEGKKLEKGKKSLTFALSFQSPEKTLTDEEVNPVFDKIITTLHEKLGATLRDA